MASNGETGSLLLAASACVHIDVCVCWRDRLLGSEGRGADRPQRRRRGAQQGERVWAPKYHRSEMGRRSNPLIFNGMCLWKHPYASCGAFFIFYFYFEHSQNRTDHPFKSKNARIKGPNGSRDLLNPKREFCGGISGVSVITRAVILKACALQCICANDKYPSPPPKHPPTYSAPPPGHWSVSQT